MVIEILGLGCRMCAQTEAILRQAVDESGYDAEIRAVKSLEAILSFGILRTPAVVIDGKVMSQGTVPSRKVAEEWLVRIMAKDLS
jgi:small redox-active disulfide protein 2